ncbi:hypothetical protein QZH41_002357 [Actinostola sp. cb2023]|nr:hypothetical protein QZH41_002357 [Actinostola sp. cb2023]
MATSRDSLDVEPAVKATGANRQLIQKNSRATDNWFRVRNALDREKRQYESKINMDKNALLKQRERLQSTTITLNTVHEVQANVSATQAAAGLKLPGQDPAINKRRLTLADVYDSMIKSVREQKQQSHGDNKSVHSEPIGRKVSTASFDNKKVSRKPAKFTLQSLQRAQSNLQEKLQAIAQAQKGADNDTNKETITEPPTDVGFFDLSESEKSLGPKLLLPPTTLPPIRCQSVFKPRARSFEHTPVTPKSEDYEDIKYCRYIRRGGGGRRNSAPAVRPGVVLKRPTKLH